MKFLQHLPLYLFPFLSLVSAEAQGVAEYRVRFDATWSSTTHPTAFPGGAHFSPIVGATHGDALHLWEAGGIATPGMESMAETGATGTLLSEVNAHITAGLAGEAILGNGIGTPATTGKNFVATSEHSRVTVVTMIAPSPDWFLGVDGVQLLENGRWVDSLVVELYAWDAGTDSGTGFNSGNLNTNPQDPIALMTNGPFFGIEPLGTFTFTRKRSTLVYGCGINPVGSLTVSGLPSVGDTVEFTLSDPTGTVVSPAATFLGVSRQPDAAFPCGTHVPGLGLGGPVGELLVQVPFRAVPGPVAMAGEVTFDFNLPNLPALVSQSIYVQGFFQDGTGKRGATEAVELFVGL